MTCQVENENDELKKRIAELELAIETLRGEITEMLSDIKE